MPAEFWAMLTAACWAVGSLLEKKGVKLGNFTPVMGTTIRTAVSLLLLSLLSIPYWNQVRAAGLKPIMLIALGGGVIAGGLGIICLYTGLKSGHLSTVTAIAFCLVPVLGSCLGYLFLQERLAPLQILGIAMCIVGAAMTVTLRGAASGR